MKNLSMAHAISAVSSMRALEQVLEEELHEIELSLEQLDRSGIDAPDSFSQERDTYIVARASIHGCLASITDVLGWVNLVTEKDGKDEANMSLGLLPEVPLSSIN